MAKSVIESLVKIFKSSCVPVLPENLIKKSLSYNSNIEQLNICDHSYNLADKNVFVIGSGKAVKNMAIEVENMLDSKIKGGYISIPMDSKIEDNHNRRLTYLEGAKNNLPDKGAESTSKQVKSLISTLGINDFLIVLISGGGSALLPLPKPPITLEEKTALIKKLANRGADIKELNTVRKRISDLKGGQLAIQAQPAQIITLILSDIVGDPLDLIASGPTVENKDAVNAALEIIMKYDLFEDLPISIKYVIESKQPYSAFPHDCVHNYVIGSNKLSIDAAVPQAQDFNYLPIELSYTITGNVKEVAIEYLKLTQLFCDFNVGKVSFDTLKCNLKKVNLPIAHNNIDILKSVDKIGDICLIFGGETTVEVKGTGIGGRNQQLALEFSLLLNENRKEIIGHDIFILSAGTDGIDGPTDAAGGIGYSNLVTDSILENLDVNTYLNNNDSYSFYKQFRKGELHIVTGHTNTNVMDIHLILIKRH